MHDSRNISLSHRAGSFFSLASSPSLLSLSFSSRSLSHLNVLRRKFEFHIFLSSTSATRVTLIYMFWRVTVRKNGRSRRDSEEAKGKMRAARSEREIILRVLYFYAMARASWFFSAKTRLKFKTLVFIDMSLLPMQGLWDCICKIVKADGPTGLYM